MQNACGGWCAVKWLLASHIKMTIFFITYFYIIYYIIILYYMYIYVFCLVLNQVLEKKAELFTIA